MWFLDTGYLIALFSEKDTFHAAATRLRAQAIAGKHRLLPTDAVLFEIGAAFSKTAYRVLGAQIIEMLLRDPDVEVVKISPQLRGRAIELFAARADKDWSLCDCLSFVVMQQHNITEALSPDQHFAQAGFTPLLLQLPCETFQ